MQNERWRMMKRASVINSMKRLMAAGLAVGMLAMPVVAQAAQDVAIGGTCEKVDRGDEMNFNNGTVNTNNGTIVNNYGKVLTNNGTIEENTGGGCVEYNYGTIKTNYGNVMNTRGSSRIEANYNYVTVSHCDGYGTANITNNMSTGTVEVASAFDAANITNNMGTIKTSDATVTVTNNTGTITAESDATVTVTNNYCGTVSDGVTVTNNYYIVTTDSDLDKVADVTYTKKEYQETDYILSSDSITVTAKDTTNYKLTGVVAKDASGDVTGTSTENADGSWTISGFTTSPKIYGSTECKHASKSDWKTDSSKHWKECANSSCGKKVDEAEHTYGDWSDGARTCTECAYEETCSHTYGDWSDGVRTCTTCGFKDSCSHTYDEGKVTTEPTETTEGVKTYTCTVCGYTKTESINALDGDDDENTGDDDKSTDDKSTDDKNSDTDTDSKDSDTKGNTGDNTSSDTRQQAIEALEEIQQELMSNSSTTSTTSTTSSASAATQTAGSAVVESDPAPAASSSAEYYAEVEASTAAMTAGETALKSAITSGNANAVLNYGKVAGLPAATLKTLSAHPGMTITLTYVDKAGASHQVNIAGSAVKLTEGVYWYDTAKLAQIYGAK